MTFPVRSSHPVNNSRKTETPLSQHEWRWRDPRPDSTAKSTTLGDWKPSTDMAGQCHGDAFRSSAMRRLAAAFSLSLRALASMAWVDLLIIARGLAPSRDLPAWLEIPAERREARLHDNVRLLHRAP